MIALRELRRSPRRFVTATVVLTLLVVLLLFLGGLLDGLYLGSTGALRAQRGDVIVYASDANDSVIRSRIDPRLRAEVAAAPRVTSVNGLGITLVGTTVPGRRDLADTAVVGYEQAPHGVPAPPPVGEAWADRRLQAFGVRLGQTLGVGAAKVPVTVRGWVRDTNYLLQGALWVEPTTWRKVQNTSRPDSPVTPGDFQVLSVNGSGSPAALARSVDAATGGATTTLTKPDAVLSAPGTREQKSTFTGIIGVAFLVVALVVALFFVLLTIERTALYGVLKALGGRSSRLFAGLIVQAVTIVVVAFAAGELISVGLAAVLPAKIPLELQTSRAVSTFLGMVVAAVVGGAFSLRRIVRTDPMAAIGTSN